MPSEKTASKGIRLPVSLWERIDYEADMSGQSRSAWLTTRLAKSLRLDRDVLNQYESVRKTRDAEDIASALRD